MNIIHNGTAVYFNAITTHYINEHISQRISSREQNLVAYDQLRLKRLNLNIHVIINVYMYIRYN